jgi:undecaprenyl diphosphate synthase
MSGISNADISELRTDSTRQLKWPEKYGINHLAIIPDGNRRWAAARSLPVEAGHDVGLLEVLPSLVDDLAAAGVHTVTIWGFSTENWNRDVGEVRHLMGLAVYFLMNRLLGIARRHDGRVIHMGRKDRIDSNVLAAIRHVEESTANNKSRVFNMAFDYGGRDELTRATARMLTALRAGATEDELRIEDFLDTSGQLHPEPDLVIRSSGEQRMSGFMPWQAAYSEIFFVEQYFPDFDFKLLEQVAEQFRARKRRFGS